MEYEKGRKCPEWLEKAVFYQIYPQSFKDSNGDGIGDFGGIMEKLDYIRELGCTALWLNPCFMSPFMDGGYDISDYFRTAPRYGTNEDLKRLFEEVHKRGMHILLDLVPGHTSVEHPWFKESCRAEKNAFTDRYVWTDSIWEEPERGSCIRGISERDGSCVVNYFSHQPALNYGYYKPDPAKPWQQPTDGEGPEATVRAMMEVMRFWLKLGCDGFRADMAGSLVKCDREGLGTIGVWQKIRRFLDEEFPEAVMVSEWGEPDKSLLGGFHMDFLLHFVPSHYNDLFRCEHPFFGGQGDAKAFVEKYEESRAKSGGRGLICIPSGNHDMDRLARRIQGDRLVIAFAFLLSMPGAPFIYYGDEIGMRYVEGLTSVEGGYGRTGSRTPMQWDDSLNAGFSAAPPDQLYIPLDEKPDRPTAAAQMKDEHSLRSQIKQMIQIRQSHPALQSRGDITFLHVEKDAYPLAYLRQKGEETILAVLNPSAHPASVPFHGKLLEPLYSTGGEAETEKGTITVPARSAFWYKAKIGISM